MKSLDSSRTGTGHIGVHLHGTARSDERVLREARTLTGAGYAVTIVDNDSDLARPRTETFQGITLRHVRVPGAWGMRWVKRLKVTRLAWLLVWNTRALLAFRADAYHAHDGNTLLAAYIAGRLRRKPIVFDAHELPYVERYFVVHRIQRRLLIGLLRRLMRRLSAVITVSPPIADEIQQRYGGPHAVLVRNVPAFHPPISSNKLRERLRLPDETRIALYQGNLQEDRSLEVLVRAARYLPEGIVIVLMGNGPSKAALEALIAAERVGERVRLLPAVPYAELLAWTASADLGLIIYPPTSSLNVRYCLPNKLFEYLMAGLPVLTSSLEAVAEVLARYEVGQVCPNLEPEAVAQAITAMLADNSTVARQRANALAAAHELNWEVEQTVLLQLYESQLHLETREKISEMAH